MSSSSGTMSVRGPCLVVIRVGSLQVRAEKPSLKERNPGSCICPAARRDVGATGVSECGRQGGSLSVSLVSRVSCGDDVSGDAVAVHRRTTARSE